MKNKKLLWLLVIPAFFALKYLWNYENHWIEGHYTSTKIRPAYFRNLQIHSYLDNKTAAPLFSDASFVDFFRNGTYVMYWHNFEYGSYDLTDSTVVMTNQDDVTWELKYERDDSTGVRSFSYPKKEEGYGAPLEMNYRKNSNSSSYPFTLENNKWRIKAEKDLSKNEIIDRLQNMIGYYIKCVKWSNEEKFKFKFYSTPSPLRASGYFFIARSKEKSEKWCEFFSNPDDCDESLQIIRQFLRENKLDWHTSINGYLRIIAALEHLEEGVGQYRE